MICFRPKTLRYVFALGFLTCLLNTTCIYAVQIQSICRIKGQEPVRLSGLGLVVGLNGTGDARFTPMHAALAQALGRLGNPVGDIKELVSVRNCAIVTVNCESPRAGGREGDTLDCFVTSIGTARSLASGRLLRAPMQGPFNDDDSIYAIAEGAVMLEGAALNHGRVKLGARLLADLPNPFLENRSFESLCVGAVGQAARSAGSSGNSLGRSESHRQPDGKPSRENSEKQNSPKPSVLKPIESNSKRAKTSAGGRGSEIRRLGFQGVPESPDWNEASQVLTLVMDDAHANFATAFRIADRINKTFETQSGAVIARALDAKNIAVAVPSYPGFSADAFLADLMELEVSPQSLHSVAKVVINERTGTIIVTGEVEITPVLVSHKNLVLAPVEGGESAPPNPFTALTETGGPPPAKPTPAKLNDLLTALNRAQVSADDRIAILKELEKSGKLHATVVWE